MRIQSQLALAELAQMGRQAAVRVVVWIEGLAVLALLVAPMGEISVGQSA